MGIPTKLVEINNEINRMVTYTKDDSRDTWQTLNETCERKQGDCEDYACAKFHRLVKEGFEPYILYCKIGGQAHMVCVCEDWVLDNYIPEILKLSDRTDLIGVYELHRTHGKVKEREFPLSQVKKWSDWLKRSGF